MNNFDESWLNCQVALQRLPHQPKFWFNDQVSINLTCRQDFVLGTIFGLDYVTTDIRTRESVEFFWMYHIHYFTFHGWFSEASLIKFDNNPTVLIHEQTKV